MTDELLELPPWEERGHLLGTGQRTLGPQQPVDLGFIHQQHQAVGPRVQEGRGWG
jgi:hypothetical protein